MPPFAHRPRALVLYAVLAAVYLGLALPHLALPALHPEEGSELVRAWQLVRTPGTAGIDQQARWPGPPLPAIVVGDRQLPLMEDAVYVGGLELWLQMPFFAVLGENPSSIRLVAVLAVLGGTLAAVALVRRWFGEGAAWLTGLLAVTHPVVVHLGRQAHEVEEFFTCALFWAGLLPLARYVRTGCREARWLALGGLCFGLGLWHKITFVWYFLGLLVAAVLVPRLAGVRLPRPPTPHLAPAALAFLAGAAPLAAFNLTHDFATVRRILGSAAAPTAKAGIDNADYLANLGVRLGQISTTLLAGRIEKPFWQPVVADHDLVYNWPLAAAFWIGLALLAACALRRRARWPLAPTALLAAVFTTATLLSPITVSGLSVNNLIALHPIPALVVALGMLQLEATLPWPRPARALTVATAALLIGLNVGLTLAYTRCVVEFGPRDPLLLMTSPHPAPDGMPAPPGGSGRSSSPGPTAPRPRPR